MQYLHTVLLTFGCAVTLKFTTQALHSKQNKWRKSLILNNTATTQSSSPINDLLHTKNTERKKARTSRGYISFLYLRLISFSYEASLASPTSRNSTYAMCKPSKLSKSNK